MSSVIDNSKLEQRSFPRIVVACPVLYRVSPAKRWQVARLVNFSATGLCMICDSSLVVGDEISVQIKPGRQKVVPAISAIGVVVRAEINGEHQFVISCKLTKVLR